MKFCSKWKYEILSSELQVAGFDFDPHNFQIMFKIPKNLKSWSGKRLQVNPTP